MNLITVSEYNLLMYCSICSLCNKQFTSHTLSFLWTGGILFTKQIVTYTIEDSYTSGKIFYAHIIICLTRDTFFGTGLLQEPLLDLVYIHIAFTYTVVRQMTHSD